MLDYKKIPKVDLHRHLEGSLRLTTLLEVAQTLKHPLPLDPSLQMAHFQVIRPLKNLSEVLSRFATSQILLSSSEVLTRVTFEACEDAYLDGVRLLELRYSPTFIAEGHPDLSYEKIHRAILEGLKMARQFPMAVGLIGILQRTQPISKSVEVVDFMIENRDSFIALDLADDENGFKAAAFSEVMTKAKKAGLHITVHAGEVADGFSHQNVRAAIDCLRAERIGHGLQIIHDTETLNYVKEKKIPLELCVTSNWITQAIARIEDHPLKKLYEEGVNVTLNTDDPGIFGIDFSHECQIVCEVLGFSEPELLEMMKRAARASFIDESLKKKFFPLVEPL